MDERPLLLLDPLNRLAALHPWLGELGWKITTPETAPPIAPPPVGLVTLDRDTIYRRGDILEETLRLAPETEWVGLVCPPCLNHFLCHRIAAEYLLDYHTLPPDRRRLADTLGHALGMSVLRRQRPNPQAGELPTGGMLGSSPATERTSRALAKLALVDAPVLIAGEAGVGKAFAARTIHARSPRSATPFVDIDCNACPTERLQSELFGRRPAANRSDQGAWSAETGRGGTLLLDNVGALAMDAQRVLLRSLQESATPRTFRIISTSPDDLSAAVTAGQFIEGLYERLNTLHLHLPALRERQGDVELLALHYLRSFSRDQRRKINGFSESALRVMNAHDWPGNNRELAWRIRRAIVFGERRYISPADLGLERRKFQRTLKTLEHARAEAEIGAIHAALQKNRHNITASAKDLGISRVTLYRLMEKYGLLGRVAAVR